MKDLSSFFRPKSVALVGATEKSGWSAATYANLISNAFPGDVFLLNPKGAVVHGVQTFASFADVPGQVDLAYVMTPIDAVIPVMEAGARQGVRNYVVLTSGYGEVGAEGAAKERELVDFAAANDLIVLGPNGNGFINATDSITPYGLPIPKPLLAGSVGVVLQSGALASSVLSFAHARSIGLSFLTSMGNESIISVTDVVAHLVDDPQTKCIALFLESIRYPDEFIAVAQAARDAGKPIVALKIGRSAKASRTAQAHTGALVGDDRTVDAVFEQLGILRVASVEDLLTTASLLAEVGPLPGRRLGVVTPSGGASEIISDRAMDEGLDLVDFAEQTTAKLVEILPDFASANNPLDVTGYVLLDRTLLGRAMEVVVADPGVDVTMLLSELPRAVPPDMDGAVEMWRANAARIEQASTPVVAVSTCLTDINEVGREIRERSGFPLVLGGIEHAMTAIGNAVRYPELVRTAGEPPIPPLAQLNAIDAERTGVWGEQRSAEQLRRAGVPVVPAELVDSADEAVRAADAVGYPVVLKIAGDEIAHKSDIGGVRLALADADAVRTAYDEMLAAVQVAGVKSRTVLVQPMRPLGTELLVGVVRDPVWGLTLAIALGGVWVELMDDSVLRVLPVSAASIRGALEKLRGIDALKGARGAQPVDLDALVEVIGRVVALAQALGEELESLEINPLRVSGGEIEALDALITWR
ncbi:CoA-binding protein [Epidermidibacterium keratini]|uniref:CoA-binding protein n=1 Tax=Epidermidibacterium keratini TaxID=1891644 RepID=A0A7L4YPS9_9ACTN|nr:acetate--CoA ligase family protein [Epidermidibacterium keratini]QHC01281.1 CoA-binding protein [Epidermidibacterium keratini]